MYNDIPLPTSLYTNPWPLKRTRPVTNLWEVSIGHFATVVACWQGTLTPPNTWSRPMLGLAYVLPGETNSFPEPVVIFSGLCTSNIPRYFLDYAFHQILVSIRVSATVVTCRQGTLTLPGTWFRPPFLDLLMLQLLRLVFTNLPCLFSTVRLENPSVLSPFSFWWGKVV